MIAYHGIADLLWYYVVEAWCSVARCTAETSSGKPEGVTASAAAVPLSRPPLTLFSFLDYADSQLRSEQALLEFTMRSLLSVLQRTAPAAWSLPIRGARNSAPAWKVDSICTRCRLQQKRQFSKSRQLTESLLNVDHPAKLVRVNQKHGPGLIILGGLSSTAALRRR